MYNITLSNFNKLAIYEGITLKYDHYWKMME